MNKFSLIFVLVALAIVDVQSQPSDSEQPSGDSSFQELENVIMNVLIEKYTRIVKEAGMKDEQVKPITDMRIKMSGDITFGDQKSILADNCKMLNDDGVLLEVAEKDMPDKKWSELLDANMSTKMNFWWNITRSDCEACAMKASKNVCVLFMNPEERKKIEEWAKEAGIKEEIIPMAVELEMRIQMANNATERDDMIKNYFETIGNKNCLLEPLSADEMEILKKMKNEDYLLNTFQWSENYYQTTGADHMKALKNILIYDWAEKNMRDVKTKEGIDQ